MSSSSNATDSRPNILFLTVDQWAASLFGYEGHPVVLTPTIDQLARLGTRFSHAYSESPICIPARRSMMTGLSPRTHGDRSFLPEMRMPDVPTLPSVFRSAGYQTRAVGKLHVYPQRDRIGFDEVVLAEEGRQGLGAVDDYDLYLADQGKVGQQFAHGMSNNGYEHRQWHLAEELHVTNWLTRAACREIKRRDPTRPSFWHVSYTHPHSPLVPLAAYEALYAHADMDMPISSDWSSAPSLPPALQLAHAYWPQQHTPDRLRAIRRAYYALCTHVDHQVRVIIGTLREEGLLDNTVILFTADHGDMLGDHGLWAKRFFYEGSSRIPMLLVDVRKGERAVAGTTDDRLVCLRDVMPTLLDMAGLEIPSHVEGLSMVAEHRRDVLYGECGEALAATRMVCDGRYKLIWYPAGNIVQLFDLCDDPGERHDLHAEPAFINVRQRLEQRLVNELYGSDLDLTESGRLVGSPTNHIRAQADRGLAGQRGIHYPQPPLTGMG